MKSEKDILFAIYFDRKRRSVALADNSTFSLSLILRMTGDPYTLYHAKTVFFFFMKQLLTVHSTKQ